MPYLRGWEAPCWLREGERRRVTLATEVLVNVWISYSRTGPVPAGCEGAVTGVRFTPDVVRPYD